jgi:hypothetical protein
MPAGVKILRACCADMPRTTWMAAFDGVRKVRLEDMPLEGALRRAPTGPFDILVRADRPLTRQRFSTAHELGHTLFHRFAPTSKRGSWSKANRLPSKRSASATWRQKSS